MTPRNANDGAGDYGGDMRASWSPEDTEIALRGQRPPSADAARLMPAIAALRSRAHGTADPSAVAAMAHLLAEATLAPAATGGARALRPVTARPSAPWRRRASIAGIAAILAAAGLAGTAAAANGAAPGDALYGVDRALEVVGIDNGGASERLAEAGKLAAEGNVEGALHHAADALRGAGDSSSSEALVAAADRIVSSGNGNSAEVKARVSQMLMWMTTADVKGTDFGQTVSSYARGVGGSQDGGSTPGKSGDAATPNDQGNPGSAGKSDHSVPPGKSGDAGKSGSPNKSVPTPSGASEDHPGKRSGG